MGYLNGLSVIPLQTDIGLRFYTTIETIEAQEPFLNDYLFFVISKGTF